MELIKTDYLNSNGAVAVANVYDFGALGDGISDDTEAFKTALEYANSKGGIVYAPAGVYKLTGELIIEDGITLLGDFKKPTVSDPKAGGTILALYPKTCTEGNNKPFFFVRKAASLNGLTFWYPEQKFICGQPIAYPETVLTEVLPSSLENLNFVNSYYAINQDVRGDYTIQQLVRGIFGTPLYKGFWFDKAPDVCRQLQMDYRPDWWLKSGLPGVPDEAELKNWLYNNAVAFDLGHIDWHFVGEITVRGYNVGVRILNGFGRAFKLDIKECKTCLEFRNMTYYGTQLLDCKLSAVGGSDAVALKISACQDEGAASVNSCEIESEGVGIMLLDRAVVTVQDSRISAPIGIKAESSRGFSGVNCDLNCETVIDTDVPDICSLTNCKDSDGNYITEDRKHIYTAVYSDENVNVTLDKEALNDRMAKIAVRNPQVEGKTLVNAADFGVNEESEDVSAALQAAIDSIADKGGVVYLPAGNYKIESPVTVKSGVELRGSTPHYHYPIGKTAYFITDYGKGDVSAPALFTLEEKSGLRGISVSYAKVREKTVCEYAPTIRGKGSDIFVIGVTVTACWIGIDFNTYRCDRHYVDGFVFAAFGTGISIGGGSEDGVVLNAHANPGQIWDNPFTERESWITSWNGTFMRYMVENVTGYYVGESKNETIYMSFIFGTVKGVHIDNGAKGLYIISHGIDFSSVGFYLEGESDSVILDNQLVGTWEKKENQSTAVLANESFTGRIDFYNLCPWNIHDSAVRAKSGEININGGVFFESGDFGVLAVGGKTTVSGVSFIRRTKNDFTTLDEKAELCAFGNIHLSTPYALKKAAKISGSDINKITLG